MNKENYESLKKQLEKQSLDIPSQITILEIAYKNEQIINKIKDWCYKKGQTLNATDILKIIKGE